MDFGTVRESQTIGHEANACCDFKWTIKASSQFVGLAMSKGGLVIRLEFNKNPFANLKSSITVAKICLATYAMLSLC